MIILLAYVVQPMVAAPSVMIIKMEGLEEVRTLQDIQICLGQGSLGS